jgi:hypothetical protein
MWLVMLLVLALLLLVGDGGRSILLLEDVDAAFVDRSAGGGGAAKLTFSGLLNAIDGVAAQVGWGGEEGGGGLQVAGGACTSVHLMPLAIHCWMKNTTLQRVLLAAYRNKSLCHLCQSTISYLCKGRVRGVWHQHE